MIHSRETACLSLTHRNVPAYWFFPRKVKRLAIAGASTRHTLMNNVNFMTYEEKCQQPEWLWFFRFLRIQQIKMCFSLLPASFKKKFNFKVLLNMRDTFFLVMIIIGNNNTKIYSQYQITWTLPHSDGSGLWHWCSRTGVMCRAVASTAV